MSYATITFEENTGKLGAANVPLKAAATDTQIVTLTTAMKAVTFGPIRKASKSVDVSGFTPVTTAAPKTAQRGKRWFVEGVGADGFEYDLTIPTANEVEITTVGSDVLDITSGKGATLKTAIEGIWADDDDGAMTVTRITFKNVND